jgi:hypothetical protein
LSESLTSSAANTPTADQMTRNLSSTTPSKPILTLTPLRTPKPEWHPQSPLAARDSNNPQNTTPSMRERRNKVTRSPRCSPDIATLLTRGGAVGGSTLCDANVLAPDTRHSTRSRGVHRRAADRGCQVTRPVGASAQHFCSQDYPKTVAKV